MLYQLSYTGQQTSRYSFHLDKLQTETSGLSCRLFNRMSYQKRNSIAEWEKDKLHAIDQILLSKRCLRERSDDVCLFCKALTMQAKLTGFTPKHLYHPGSRNRASR